MKTRILSIAMAVVLFTGCESIKNSNKQQRGTAIGAAGGAILGTIIGNNVGDGDNQTEGAVIGAVVGGVAGNVIGRRMDKQAQEIQQELPGAEVERVGEGIVVTFDEGSGIKFATNQSTLNAGSKATLDKLVSVMNDYPGTEILVSGHTDSTGDAAYNLELSRKRAFAVRDYLVEDGIASSRMAVTYSGETDPKATNETAEGRAQNRRVEIGIVAGEEMRREAEQEVKG
ncbi:OmpA family protein [Nonlabens ponticola]|uniref:Glycine zipper 2TM domain-containing protein n=1 Tax=Nonlabens ponticola TaxID=2496866 RepID=A0A3S9MYW4_9FLAO|nr:OmpA family protein [Nonlabens ponticola]AZQ44380.1 glycine zipper 2TM domain-containing protein [Nonlabens ponticola]